MRLDEKIKKWKEDHPKSPFFSLEFFPPKTETGVLNLYDRFDRFASLNPLWIDVTWGAGGSTSEKTLSICANALKFHGLETLMHLTCTNMSEKKLISTLEMCKRKGIRNLLALRGDPPLGKSEWTVDDTTEFRYAVDLVAYIRKRYGDYFCIVVGGYPEGHLENPNPENDLTRLKEKVDAGAQMIVTQLFFDMAKFETFYKKCRDIGIQVPIIPGILPIQSYAGFKRFITFCKTSLPNDILDRLESVKDDDQKVKDYGVELAIQMCRQLLAMGLPGLHFYTLNLEVSVLRILDGLNILDLPNREMPWRPRIRSRRTERRIKKPLGELSPDGETHESAVLTQTDNNTSEQFSDANENVRPIFWSNRPRSYIYRTAGWDDFPNGRWGPRDSPAYGEPFYSMSTDSSDRSVQTRQQMWGASLDSIADVIEVFVNNLKTPLVVKRIPWTNETIGEETSLIKKQLIKLNTLGLCTINSQPRVNGALSTDPIFGWGPRGGYVYQKAYIEFFCSPALWDKLYAFLEASSPIKRDPHLSYMAVSRRGPVVTNVHHFGGRDSVNAVTWGVFPNSEIRQPTVVDLESFDVWKGEAFDLWLIEWGSIYANESPSKKIIEDICETWYLVNLVDNNLLSGDLFVNLIRILTDDYIPDT